MSRLDAVRITVTLTGAAAALAVQELALGPAPAADRVYFCERVDPLAAELPLHDRGLILRLRQTSDGADRCTAELRPCRRQRLGPRWLALHQAGDQWLRLEEDWAADRVLVASLAARPPPGLIEEVLTGHLPPSRLFTALQAEFLADCADADRPLTGLVVLGPIPVRRHPMVRWHGYEVTAEWWQLPAGDQRLQLGLRLAVAGAEVMWRGFDALLVRHGIAQRGPERTTSLVLTQLSRQWRLNVP
jgi:hypothetical protein